MYAWADLLCIIFGESPATQTAGWIAHLKLISCNRLPINDSMFQIKNESTCVMCVFGGGEHYGHSECMAYGIQHLQE